ncbi:MAG TPA: hypothetical protein VHJ20_18335 [Polyangia bacterium]|nr:hypothetical protein [Polyangia bacterium]
MKLAPTLLALTISAATLATSTWARAEDAPSLVHPIYAQLPDLPENEVTRRAFAAAATRYKIAPLEVIDIEGAKPPTAPKTLKATIAKALKLSFSEALGDLDTDLAEISDLGGAGLTTAELSDVYLFHAMATARADWNAVVPPEMAAFNPARARAFPDYVRAAMLTPDRTLDAHTFPPQVVADFARGLDVARALPRVTLVIHGDADAMISVDGAPPLPVNGGLTIKDLPEGDHFVSVTELGRAPWGSTLTIANGTYELTIPDRAAVGLSDAVAAAHARRMGARFALVGERKPGAGSRLEVRLVDLSGTRRDGVIISATEDEHGAVDAAVMRLDEQARQIQQLEIAGTLTPAAPVDATGAPDATAPTLLAPPRPRATFHDDPAAWARDRWPLLTAIGVVAASAVVLGLAAR